MPEVIAEAKFIRMSPRKIRRVVEALKGLRPKEALGYLKFMNKRAAEPMAKVIKSALANAKSNLGLNEETWRFKSIEIQKGPILKRGRAASRGRSHPIQKKMSHIKVVLTDEDQRQKS